MHIRRLSLALVVSLAFPLAVAHANNPIPGVGIIVKRNPCCASAKVVVPGGFFGPGSAPFSGTVAMEGRCSHDCGGCDNCAGSPAPDSRLDYAADSNAGPFEVTMAATTMYSTEPIEVSIDGVPSFFDVFVELSGPGPESDDAISGVMTLAPGASLDPGTIAPVSECSLDITYKITFHDHTTGDPAGSFVTGGPLEAILKDLGLLVPAARVAGGTPAGQIVLGFDGSNATQFVFATPNDELVIQMLSLYQNGPVAAQPSTWGSVKGLYR